MITTIKKIFVLLFIFNQASILYAQVSIETVEEVDEFISARVPSKLHALERKNDYGELIVIELMQGKNNKDYTLIKNQTLENADEFTFFHYYKNQIIKITESRAKQGKFEYYYRQGKTIGIKPVKLEGDERTQKYALKNKLEAGYIAEEILGKYDLRKRFQKLWYKDVNEAFSRAKIEGKLVMAVFNYEYGGVKNLFFETEEFMDYADNQEKILFLRVPKSERTISDALEIQASTAYTKLLNPIIEIIGKTSLFKVYYEPSVIDHNLQKITPEEMKKIKEIADDYIPVNMQPFTALRKDELDFLIRALDIKKYDINKMVQNKTLAMVAAELGNKRAIDILHERKADFSIKNKKGLTAKDYAIKKGFEKIAKYIDSLK